MLWVLILAAALAVAPPTTMVERSAPAVQENHRGAVARWNIPRNLHPLTLAPNTLTTGQTNLPAAAPNDFWFVSEDYPVVTPGNDDDTRTDSAIWCLSGHWLTGGARLRPEFSQAAEGLVVGAERLRMVRAPVAGYSPPKVQEARQQRLLLRINPDDVSRADPFGGLGQVIDVTSFDMTEFQADVVHVTLPTGPVQPFAALAHQYDELDTIDRYGIGGGTRWTISPNANLGTQLLYFPGDKTSTDPDILRSDIRLMARLEIRF